jgi:hypothetical protein
MSAWHIENQGIKIESVDKDEILKLCDEDGFPVWVGRKRT